MFLDLETCGFSGNPLFLVGAVLAGGGRARAVQLLARNYAEEASVIEAALGLFRGRPLLVTFNGKAYDLPFLRDRACRHGMRVVEPAGHLDLLHAARRRWRGGLPDCRLATLERRLLGVVRADDLPGREVPERYHAFVRGAGSPAPILRHNLTDLATLISILALLHRPPAAPRLTVPTPPATVRGLPPQGNRARSPLANQEG